ncbi:TonB-dependent receptor [Sporomusa termitida]|uniref:TonB-dependent receptor n=1 Tax=Sporomusa termitida TaxID=2377 RepID=UPI003CCC5EC8
MNEEANRDKPWQKEYALEAVTVEAPRPDWESKLSPGTVTVIEPDKYKGEQKTLPELLKDVPGVHIREVMGKGQYTTVSVRGSTAAQVGVFVDGVLVNLGGDAAVDLSTIPVKNVARIEVYRGYVPARFGGTYMGGVINVVTKKPEKANVSASFGQRSYGGYSGSLELDMPLGKGSLLVGINRDQSDGNFKYTNFEAQKLAAGAQAQYDRSMAQFEESIQPVYEMYAPIFGWTSIQDMLNDPDMGPMFAKFPAHNYWEVFESQPTQDATRVRQNNDYKNTDVLIKWQDDHWLIKGSWKNIDRGLPDAVKSIWQDLPSHFIAPPDPLVDQTENDYVRRMKDAYQINQGRRQNQTDKALQVGRRDNAGNMEWGWRLDYQDEDKDYHSDIRRIQELVNPGNGHFIGPLREWSSYNSGRFGGALDGSYKAGSNHLLEFMANYSHETLRIDGNGMDNINYAAHYRYRYKYEQDMFNIQLQDTITLNKAGDFWFTPSVRYNYSQVTGYSRYANPEHPWTHSQDEQSNGKATWQAALKKQLDDHWTLRSTFGTYYRLLNLYEIAGDGAGILPKPDSDRTDAMFPLPEEGTQWDFSVLYQGNMLNAKSNFALTYFGRDSDNMLQLRRDGYDYWCYSNAAKGKANGVELQSSLKWDKWDLDLSATYLNTKAQTKYGNRPDSPDSYWQDIVQPYTPDWEGSLRLTYRPDTRTALFAEVKYVDEMYVRESVSKWQTALTTVGLGVKHKLNKDLQFTVGVNDLFNKGPEIEERAIITNPTNPDYPVQITQAAYPMQGRTYYATMQYNF